MLICTREMSFVRSVASSSRWFMSSSWFSSSRTNFSTIPFFSAKSCHGTMLLWCSATDRMTSSPAWSALWPHVFATRLMASVAFLVKTMFSGEAAFTNLATLQRASSYSVVARADSACTPRCTLLLYCR